MLKEKRISTKFGRMSYFTFDGKDHNILFIHDNTSTKEWFAQPEIELPEYNWIIPDLIGFGTSSRCENIDAYSIEQYTEDMYMLLVEEKIDKLVIIAHGLGAVIAHNLSRYLVDRGITVNMLIYINGTFSSKDMDPMGKDEYDKYLERHNFDIERYTRLNTTYSKLIVKHLKKLDPFSIWATHKQLDKYLENDIMKGIKECDIPTRYLIGEHIRGERTSEKLMKSTEHVVSFIPDTKFNIHIENPPELWKYIELQFESL